MELCRVRRIVLVFLVSIAVLTACTNRRATTAPIAPNPSPKDSFSSLAPSTSSIERTPPSSLPGSNLASTPSASLPTATIGSWTGIEPHTIYFSADSGNVVTRISWSSWSWESAVGRGFWGYNTCTPNCARGKVTQYPTTITLNEPKAGQFTRLAENQSGPYGHRFEYSLPNSRLGGAS